MSQFTIYHNPRCSKSRQTLQLLEDNNVKPTIIEYLKETPSEDDLRQLLNLLDISAHDLLRTKEAEYKEAGLSTDSSEQVILDAMQQYPKLIERPVVIKGNSAAVIGRPPENVLALFND